MISRIATKRKVKEHITNKFNKLIEEQNGIIKYQSKKKGTETGETARSNKLYIYEYNMKYTCK